MYDGDSFLHQQKSLSLTGVLHAGVLIDGRHIPSHLKRICKLLISRVDSIIRMQIRCMFFTEGHEIENEISSLIEAYSDYSKACCEITSIDQ